MLAQSAQTITSADGTMPVLIGEYGNSTDGQNIDPGGIQTVSAVINAGSTGYPAATGATAKYGSAAWAWGTGGPGDGLTTSDGTASVPYGQMVQLAVGTTTVAPTQCQTQQQAVAAVNAAQAQVDAQNRQPQPTNNNGTPDYASLIAAQEAEIAKLKQELNTLQGGN